MMDRPLFQVDPCMLCGTATERRYTELTYHFAHVQIIVSGVPVAVCAGCDEEFVPGAVGVWLGDEVAKIAAQLDTVFEQAGIMRNMVLNFGVDGERLLEGTQRLAPSHA